MLITDEMLEPLNEVLEGLEPRACLELVHSAVGARAAILCGMQLSGTLLCHMADRAGLAYEVVFVDTGVMHAETLWTRDELARTSPNLRVTTLTPEHTFAEQTARRGLLYLSKDGQEACCELRKSAPLFSARGRWDVLIAALRRQEGGKRSRVRAIELDRANGLLRIHPLLNRTRGELDTYVAAHPDLVRNPLHAMGFPSIGCFPCTTPVRADEDARAGRWRHLADVTYCGINPTDKGGSSSAEVGDAVARLFTAAGLSAPRA